MPVRARKRWTVLIYMVADDPQGGELLDRQAVQEMDRITKATLSVKKPEHLHVAVQVDFRTLPGVWRRVIGQNTFVRPESNAADPDTLYGFFDWAANECPAEHYLLIFWGHSAGQFGMFADSDPFDYTAQTLTLVELRNALTAAKRSLEKPVDIIAFKDCFMATLEIAYELSGLADYVLASPGLVPVVGWPYDEMFGGLADDKHWALQRDQRALDAAKQILAALGDHYEVPANKDPHEEVPYSLLSTRGASAAVGKLGGLIGTNRSNAVPMNEDLLRKDLDDAAKKGRDPALVDLGALAPRSGRAALKPQQARASNHFNEFVLALGNASPALAKNRPARRAARANVPRAGVPGQLVIDHTGQNVGGVTVFVYPSSSKAQRESRVTRLADEKAYRRLAISTDTNWANVALQSMPIQPARPGPDISAAIGVLEQLQRLGGGMAPVSAAVYNSHLRRLARSRTGY